MNWQYQGARGVTSQQQQQMMFFQAQQAQQALIQQNIGSSTPKVSPNTKP